MDLNHGGHLTHGAPVTRSAKLYNFVRYKMKDPSTGEIDYDEMRAMALEHKPKLIIAGFSAYPRELDIETPPTIKPATWAISAISKAPTSFPIAANFS